MHWLEILIEVGEFIWLVIVAVFDYLFSFYSLFVPQPLKCLKNEIILVTGTGSGIGKAVCIDLVKAGAKTLVIWDKNKDSNENTAMELRSSGKCKVYTYQVDVADRNSVNQTATRVKKEVGDVTILYNNAGVTHITDFLDATPSQLDSTIQVNLVSHFYTLQEFLPSMINRGEGQVVTTCSSLGLKGVLKGVAYSASKFAIRGYIEALESEIRHHPRKPKIIFTTAYPFFVNTPLVTGLRVKYRLSFLFRHLDVSEVSANIVEGIRRNSHSIYCPWFIQWLLYLQNFGPKVTADRVMDFFIKNIDLDNSYKNSDKNLYPVKTASTQQSFFENGLKLVSKTGIIH